MPPTSTFDYGTSAAAFRLNPVEAYPVRDLASRVRRLKDEPQSGKNDQQLMEVARKFEAILIHQLLKAMRQTVPKSDLLNSFSLNQYESMLDEEIANEMAANRGIGLADTLFYQLSRLELDANSGAPAVPAPLSQEVKANE